MNIFRLRGLPTPFGKINLPEMGAPRRGFPQISERRREAIRHAIGSDLTGVIGLIPWVGDVVGGQISDLHYAEMRKILTHEELNKFTEDDKIIPSNGLALLYSFISR